MFNSTRHTLPIRTLEELLNGSYTATLQVISTYPIQDNDIAVESVYVLEEPDIIEVATEDGRNTSLKVCSMALNSQQVKLFSENGFKVLTLTLHRDHPLYEKRLEI